MHPTLTLPNSPVYQSSDRTDYRQDWLDSGVDDAIINLNVQEIAGADLLNFSIPTRSASTRAASTPST
ncbi:hypothetical protein [Kamptonema formosum]|uniref:hypothetical protein n=1 Tax=Kamptonema formosum TaxID=331992 RepID=UPI00034B09CF|nr:hypothetical protein [Kamptonema formosum]